MTWDTRANGAPGTDFVPHVAPLPWARTGPGRALAGNSKPDLKAFDPPTSSGCGPPLAPRTARNPRLRDAIRKLGADARQPRPIAPEGWAWRHPFHAANHIDGMNAGEEAKDVGGTVHPLSDPATTALQAAYIRKVVGTVEFHTARGQMLAVIEHILYIRGREPRLCGRPVDIAVPCVVGGGCSPRRTARCSVP